MRRVIGTWIGVVSLMVGLAIPGQVMAQQAAPAPADQSSDAGAPALAERIAEFGRSALRIPHVTVTNFRLAAAMMEAAAKLDPREPRYPRLWADAALEANDADSALRALKAYTALVPDDKSALIQLADLYTRSFQTLDAKLGYLLGVVDVKGLPDEVRSHLSFLLYQAYTERSQSTQAKAMLDQALTLNPLSIEALRARYQGQAADGSPIDRFATLLAILKANPAQLDALTAVGQQLANLGLAAEALPFYSKGIEIARAQGALTPDYARTYAIELAIVPEAQVTGARQMARQVVDAVLANSAEYYEAQVLKLLLQRQAGQKDDAAKTTQQALNVLVNRLAQIRQVLGDKSATTRPVESTDPVVWGSFDQDLARLKDLKPSEKVDPAVVRQALENVLAEMAWFEIYFNNKPNEATPLIDALRKLEPENSPTVTRLEGWSFLVRGEKDQAKVKLSAVKDRDPRAELGLIVMAPADARQKEGNAFVAAHPDSLVTLEALDALHDANVSLVPDAARAGPYQNALKTFPLNWLSIIDAPQQFYALRAEPMRVSHPYGEPMLVRVTIQNLGEEPITIGADGVLRPDVWLDAQVRGPLAPGVPSEFPAVAVERVAKEVVLKPKQSVSQVVRLDQSTLAQLLSENPAPALQVTFDARINPTANGIGPAGQMVQGLRLVERSSFPLAADALTRLVTALQQGTPQDKIRSLDLAAQIVANLSGQKDNPDATKAAQQLLGAVQNTTRDANASVQAWANAVLSRFAPTGDGAAFITRLANDPNWVTRVIGLVSMGRVPPQEQRALLKKAIEHDTNPLVVEVAKDLNQLIEQAAAGNAATQPASAPATAPSPSPLTPGTSGATPPAQGAKPATTSPSVTIPSDLPFTPPPQTPGK